MEVFPPLSLVLRKLVELGETCEDETTKLEIKDQVNGCRDI